MDLALVFCCGVAMEVGTIVTLELMGVRGGIGFRGFAPLSAGVNWDLTIILPEEVFPAFVLIALGLASSVGKDLTSFTNGLGINLVLQVTLTLGVFGEL